MSVLGQVWLAAFVAALQAPGVGPEAAADVADYAVQRYETKFKAIKPVRPLPGPGR